MTMTEMFEFFGKINNYTENDPDSCEADVK